MKVVLEFDLPGNPDAVLAFVEAAIKGGAKVTGKTPPPAKKTEKEAEPEAEADDFNEETPAVTMEQIKAKVVELTSGGKTDAVKKLFKTVGGVDKVSLLPAAKFEAVYKGLSKL